MDLSHMLPYLSRYLGHKTLDDTFYYYHLSAAATDIIHEKDHTSALVIPEVSRCEEV